MSRIRVKAKESNGSVIVKALMRHPMETGLRKSKDGKKIPAHHITQVTCEVNGTVAMKADFGPAVSRNPYLSFQLSGFHKGDALKLSWIDNKMKTDSFETVIK